MVSNEYYNTWQRERNRTRPQRVAALRAKMQSTPLSAWELDRPRRCRTCGIHTTARFMAYGGHAQLCMKCDPEGTPDNPETPITFIVLRKGADPQCIGPFSTQETADAWRRQQDCEAISLVLRLAPA